MRISSSLLARSPTEVLRIRDAELRTQTTARLASFRLLITIIPELRLPSSGFSFSQFHRARLAPPDTTICGEYAPHSPHDRPRPPETSPEREGFMPFRMWAFPRARIKSNLKLLGSVQFFV
jgi:hypothetical protein